MLIYMWIAFMPFISEEHSWAFIRDDVLTIHQHSIVLLILFYAYYLQNAIYSMFMTVVF